MPRPPAKALSLSDSQRDELVAITRYRSIPQSIVLRIRILLGAADGVPNKVLARKLSTTLPTVLLWRRRYEESGLSGVLEDQARSGRPKVISEDKEAAIVEATMKTKPTNATHWSIRTMAKAQRVSRSTVHLRLEETQTAAASG
jgi:transposase